MRAKLCIVALFTLSGAALAGGSACPPGALPNEAHASSGDQAWCELASDRSLLHGPYRAWHPNGVLGTEEYYVRGKAAGPAVYRWGSGEKQAAGNFKDSLPEGWWTFWDKTGAKAGRARYKNGEIIAGQLPKWALDWDGAPVAKHPPPSP